MDKTAGFRNEWNFVNNINGKKFYELDPVTQDMLTNIYGYIEDNTIIKCFKNKFQQKGDILLNVNNNFKSISIKMGAKNSVHAENIHYFVEFLKENKIPTHIIRYYLEYHYADGTLSGKGNKRLSSEEYKKDNQYKIDEINKYFSKEDFVLKCIDRFILKGTNCKFSISGIISGTPDNYFFVPSEKIKEILLKQKDNYSTGVHVTNLFIQPMARDLNFTGKYEAERNNIQVKWFNIFDDLMKNEINIIEDNYS